MVDITTHVMCLFSPGGFIIQKWSVTRRKLKSLSLTHNSLVQFLAVIGSESTLVLLPVLRFNNIT